MVLGDVEESVITREVDEETDEEIVRVWVNSIILSKLNIFAAVSAALNYIFLVSDVKAEHWDVVC